VQRAEETGQDAAGESVTIRPEAGLWPLLLGHNGSEEARRFRQQLRLPLDRPVVMTGHQAQFWHPGILAKYIAADAFANARDASPAFVVVDQDRPASAALRYPVVEPPGNLAVREVLHTPRGASRAPVEDGKVPGFVRDGIAALDSAMRAHRGEPNFARRIAFAVRDLMRPLLSERAGAASLIFTTDLCRTDLFAQLVRQMAREPERCTTAYNAAAARHADAGIRPLEANPVQDRWELPLWHLPPDGPRRHVFAEDIDRIPMNELAPKALFMTGLLRLAGCDLFIHGLGGGGDGDSGYDRITDEWFHDWLGHEPAAPITVVTATRLLPLDVPAPPTAAEVAMARWRLHHAMHHPGEVGLSALEEQRQAIVAEIAAASPHIRAELYHDLQAMLDRYRFEHAPRLDQLRSSTRRTLARRGDRHILNDRQWAFPLYPASVLEALRAAIVSRFA
jgi:hypothetical protein